MAGKEFPRGPIFKTTSVGRKLDGDNTRFVTRGAWTVSPRSAMAQVSAKPRLGPGGASFHASGINSPSLSMNRSTFRGPD